MLNLNSILLFSENPKELSEFYKKILEKPADWSEGGYSGIQAGDGHLVIGPHDKVKGKSPNPERIMFNFQTKDVKKDFERIKAIGAKVITEPYNPQENDNKDSLIATFADPDGNYFQLMSPMEM